MNHCHVHVLELHNSEERRKTGTVPYAHEVERVYSRLMPAWSSRKFLTFLWPIVRNLCASREAFILDICRSPALVERARELTLSGRFDLVLIDGLLSAPALAGWEKERQVPAILLQHNVEANIWKGMARLQRNPFTRLFYHTMARRMQRREPELCRLLDGVTAISEADAAYHRETYHLTNILGSVLPGIDFITQEPPPAVLLQEAEPCIAFVGKMNWQPNTDAVFWFIHEVLPLIRQTLPKVRFRIIGREPTTAMYRLATASTGIEITGTVEEVLPHLRECALQVVPLRAGSGVRHKILESMASGVPVVSTTLGAEGLYLSDGQEILLADDAPALCAAILRLLLDGALRKSIAEKALVRVTRDFSWEQSANKLLRLCSTLLPKKG
ncbi:glycosyltransferase family 4 protein [Prosthecobacter sp.]|uniref:glycosyltransferase family 4 protein n=1 Tax=Prosthecobacter sp. TaxID=1965333 RepID=UPI0031F2E5DF